MAYQRTDDSHAAADARELSEAQRAGPQSPGLNNPYREELDIEGVDEALLPGANRSKRGGSWRSGCIVCSTCVICLLGWYFVVWVMLAVVAQWREYPGNKFPDDAKQCEQFHFVGRDGTDLIGCRHRIGHGPAKAAFLMFHGNGGSASTAILQALMMMDPQYRAGSIPAFEVFSFSYRGYEPNKARWTSQATIVDDAEALMDKAIRHFYRHATPFNASARMLVGGWSLGAAVAIQLAGRRSENVAGLMLISPFSSMWDMALWSVGSYVQPWIWASDHWDSVGVIGRLPVDLPVVVLSAGSDLDVPPQQHRAIYDASVSTQKQLLVTRGAVHGDIQQEAEVQKAGVRQWLDAVLARLVAPVGGPTLRI